MHYFSTNRRSPRATFREAVLNGQPDDGGLYVPSEVPRLSSDLVTEMGSRSNEQIAFDVIRPFVNGDIDDDVLFQICCETVNFPFPLVPITDRISTLELFHGPTLAFKDVGARFMSRCLKYFSRDADQKTIVIVATSGDTGGAVAAGFHNVEGVEVVILFPKGKVSRVQELQLTRFGQNVTTLELRGTFDDCQAIAKQALGDADLRSRGRLTSANSMNVARWLPQQFYYFFVLRQWEGPPPVISVPSGNFGNVAAGLLAQTTGLPVTKFIAACNANDVVPEFVRTGQYQPKPSVTTLSNAMDVGDPSNFSRIVDLFGRDPDLSILRSKLAAASISDEATAITIREVYDKYGYVLDPHGAVAYRALADRLDLRDQERGIFLETAHPVKFDSVREIVGIENTVPTAIAELEDRPRFSVEIDNDYDSVKDVLLSMV